MHLVCLIYLSIHVCRTSPNARGIRTPKSGKFWPLVESGVVGFLELMESIKQLKECH